MDLNLFIAIIYMTNHYLNECTISGNEGNEEIEICFKLGQLANTLSPILITDGGIVISPLRSKHL